MLTIEKFIVYFAEYEVHYVLVSALWLIAKKPGFNRNVQQHNCIIAIIAQ